jgi:ABC-type glycerol-3-phosphate transport system substrate-binding protein
MLRYRLKRFPAFVAASALVAMVLVGGSFTSTQAAGRSAAPMTATVFASWGAGEKTDFLAILSYCDTHYHLKATYEQSTGSNYLAELSTKVQGGTAPDIAALSTPSTIEPFVAGNSLQPLTFLNQAALKSRYAPFWRNLGTINGKLYAIYMKADVKSLIWYSPKKFQQGHYQVPKTWSQLIALSQRMVKDGKQPWAFGAQDGWTLTDFLENIYLESAGPQMYVKWYNHQIPWTDPSIKHAFQLLNQIVANNSMIAGGRARALSQRWDAGATQMVTDPKAEFFQEATFVGAGLGTDLPKDKAGVDYSAFAFPFIKTWPTTPVEVGPNAMVMFHNTPGARALMTCLTDPKALAQWARLGGYISPTNDMPMSAYPDPVLRMAAELMIKAGRANLLVPDASDMMPASLGSDYEWTELQKWFKNPTSIDPVLNALEAFATKAYKSGH